MGTKNDDGWKNLNDKPRKQDPYVTGRPDGSGDSGGKSDGCADRTATLAIAGIGLALVVRALVRRG